MPEQGSVGASGDLAPLAHLALPLIGRGQAEVDGEIVSGADALRRRGLEPLQLEPKEGLALLNGTQQMTAIGVLALLALSGWPGGERRRRDVASRRYWAPMSRFRRGLPGSATAPRPGARRRRASLPAARLGAAALPPRAKRTRSRIRTRSAACRRSMAPRSTRWLRRAASSRSRSTRRTDNPLIFADGAGVDPDAVATGGGRVVSGGNFHGQPVALAMDLLTIAVAELGSISERRTPS